MNRFLTMMIRMFARRAIFSSGRKLINTWTKSTQKGPDLENVDMSEMTPKQKKAHRRKLQRQRQQAKKQPKTSPWIYILSIVVAVLVLYIMYKK